MIFHSLSVLVSSSPRQSLIYFAAALFTGSPAVSLVVPVCEYRMEAADVKQSHALDEKQAAAAESNL